MKRILLSLLLINFINLHAQSKEFCNVYLSQHENETMLEEIYVCGDKFFFKFKYGEIKDAIIKKQNDTSYKIMNIEYMLNQKYLDINKFKENKYYIAIKKDKITLKFIKNNKYKRFYNYPKLKKTIPKYLLQQTNALHKTWGGGLEKFAGGAVGMVAFGALSGGVGAELSGGNFWQGAVTGGIVAGLNHAMHKQIAKFQIKKDLRAEFQEADMDPDSKASFEDHAELTEKLPTLKNIKDKISYTVVENNKITTEGLVRETDPNTININMKGIKNLLNYAFTLGHEMIHVFDFTYNRRIIFNIFGANRTGRDAMKYISEYRAYLWQYNNGDTIIRFDKIKILAALGSKQEIVNLVRSKMNIVTDNRLKNP